MKEVITLLITSGGLGFLSLYIAQETGVLNFGNYNKEEWLAWVSIFSTANYGLVLLFFYIHRAHTNYIYDLIVGVLLLFLSTILSIVIPKVIWKIIQQLNRLMHRNTTTYLPPLDFFLTDVYKATLFAFDFDGKMINQG